MRKVTVHLNGISPYSQSRHFDADMVPKLERENADAYDKRTWREHLHVDQEGRVFIPGMAFKQAMTDACRFLGHKVPEKRNATWTKHFQSGIMIFDNLVLPVRKEDVQSERLYLNADGKRGGGTRVWRTYPVLRNWAGSLDIYVVDELIIQPVLRAHLEAAGRFIGVGRFRPQNGGFYGLFEIARIDWQEIETPADLAPPPDEEEVD
jgi:hypothetical protein